MDERDIEETFSEDGYWTSDERGYKWSRKEDLDDWRPGSLIIVTSGRDFLKRGGHPSLVGWAKDGFEPPIFFCPENNTIWVVAE